MTLVRCPKIGEKGPADFAPGVHRLGNQDSPIVYPDNQRVVYDGHRVLSDECQFE